jgi:flagellar assembly factor FliW
MPTKTTRLTAEVEKRNAAMVIMSITIRPSILSTKTMLEAPLILNASKNNLLSVMWHRQRTQICGMVM